MFTTKATLGLARLVALAVLAVAVMTGCSGDNSITNSVPDQEQIPQDEMSLLMTDPLDNSLDTTDGYTPAEPGPRIERLAEVLGLTEEQTQALYDLYVQFRADQVEIREACRSGEITIEEARAQMEELRAELEAEIQLILTPEQYELLLEMRSQRPHGEPGGPGGPDNPGHHGQPGFAIWEVWLDEIGADESQTDAVFSALEDLHTAMADLRVQVREGVLTPQEAREQAVLLREEFDTELQTILTPEQYEQLLELRPDCPRPA